MAWKLPPDTESIGGVLGAQDMPLWLQSGAQQAPPNGPAQRLLDPFNPPQKRSFLESIASALLPQMDEKGMYKGPGLGEMIALPLMGMGRMAPSARVSPPVVPLRPYKPNTTFTGDPPPAANMNPPKNLSWQGPNESTGLNVGGDSYFNKPPLPPDPVRGEPGPSFASTDRGNNLAIVTDEWNGQGGHYTYQPRIHAPVTNGTREAHQGPQFRSREVAQQYAEQLLRGGKFGPKPDPAFAAPFLEQDAASLRQLMADQARKNFRPIEGGQ